MFTQGFLCFEHDQPQKTMRNTRNAVLVSFSAKDMNFQVCLICFASNSQEHIIAGRCAQDPSWLQVVRSGGSLAGAGVCSGRIPRGGRRVQGGGFFIRST